MATRHVVVDGSNLATEGRSMPSLAQLDAAVREFLTENPDDMVTVVVDASFGHRIDPTEFKVFEEAETAGEVVSPPAGAIGRGDAFLLRIADKTGATVLSNDSFQEFHGDYEWLFERGRLIGGKPVPGVGWIFTPRTPVRGPRSREAVKEAKRKSKPEAESAVPGLDLAASRTKGKGKKTVERAIAVATEEAVAPKEKARRRRKGGVAPADPVNDPLTFITFIAAHPLGTEVTATVESFASHGAFVECEGACCYVPLSAMGDPPPKSAREIFSKGQAVELIVQALDPHRRGVELARPGYAKVAGAPTEETVEAEIGSEAEPRSGAEPRSQSGGGPDAGAPAPARRVRKRAPAAVATEPAPSSAVSGERAEDGSAVPPRRARKRVPAPPVEVAPAGVAPAEVAPAGVAPAGVAEVGEEVPAPPRRRRATRGVTPPPATGAQEGAAGGGAAVRKARARTRAAASGSASPGETATPASPVGAEPALAPVAARPATAPVAARPAAAPVAAGPAVAPVAAGSHDGAEAVEAPPATAGARKAPRARRPRASRPTSSTVPETTPVVERPVVETPPVEGGDQSSAVVTAKRPRSRAAAKGATPRAATPVAASIEQEPGGQPSDHGEAPAPAKRPARKRGAPSRTDTGSG